MTAAMETDESPFSKRCSVASETSERSANIFCVKHRFRRAIEMCFPNFFANRSVGRKKIRCCAYLSSSFVIVFGDCSVITPYL